MDSDVLVLKYADGLHGVDAAVYQALRDARLNVQLPDLHGWTTVQTDGSITPTQVIYIGVGPLHHFGYPEIRDFARTSLAAVAEVSPAARRVALTLHGANYGLDEMTAFDAEIAGLLDGLRVSRIPPGLRRITIVESERRRAVRLAARLETLLPNHVIRVDAAGYAENPSRVMLAEAATKPRVLVVMPFGPGMDEVYEEIAAIAREVGYICERADKEIFTDDIVRWVQSRIAAADLVVADLTGANPNVYLEVGYAWALEKRLLLIMQDGERPRFNLSTQRCVMYKSVEQLREQLRPEFEAPRQTSP